MLFEKNALKCKIRFENEHTSVFAVAWTETSVLTCFTLIYINFIKKKNHKI